MKTRADYRVACEHLRLALIDIHSDKTKKYLYAAGRKAWRLANSYHPAAMSPTDLNNMTTWIEGITAVMQNPTNADVLATHIANTEHAMNYGNKHKWLKVFGFSMLAIAGVALLAFSIAAIAMLATGALPITGGIAATGAIIGLVGLLLSAFSGNCLPLPPPANILPYAIGGWASAAVLGAGCAAMGTFFAVRSYIGEVGWTGDGVTIAAKLHCKKN
jgi:hypothetical protein